MCYLFFHLRPPMRIRVFFCAMTVLEILALAILFPNGNLILGQQSAAMQTSRLKEVSYSGHIYKFNMMAGGMAQIFKDGQVVGTILPDGNGGERIIGIATVTPTPDVLVAYGMYKAGAETTPPNSSTIPPQSRSFSDCPVGSLANYWDGTSWKPLKQVVALQPERGVSLDARMLIPLSPGASDKMTYRYKGSSADIRLSSKPKFCFPLSPNAPPQAVIGQLEVKGGERRTEIKSFQKHDTATPFTDKKTFEVILDGSKGTSFEATPKKPLPPGQYLVTSGYAFYDFAVE